MLGGERLEFEALGGLEVRAVLWSLWRGKALWNMVWLGMQWCEFSGVGYRRLATAPQEALGEAGKGGGGQRGKGAGRGSRQSGIWLPYYSGAYVEGVPGRPIGRSLGVKKARGRARRDL